MRWQYIIITLILISIANAIELGDLEDICPKGSILQVSSAYPHNKEWWCGLKPVNSVDNFNISGNIIFIGNVTFNNNVTGIVNVNNSDYLDGYDSSYFMAVIDQRYNETNLINRSFNQSLTDSLYYLKSNPFNYINQSNLSGYVKYLFGYNNFNGNGNFTTTGIINSSKLITTGNNICNNTVCFTLQELNASSGGWVGTAESDLDFQSTYNIVNVALINGIDPSTWITGIDWNQITGTQSDISLSGFNNDAGFLTSESDPVYSANTYAVDMNQNVGTDDSVSFTSISDGTCTITGGSLSGCTYSETDPVYSANTYATGMNQGVATSDSPDFTGLTVGSVAVLTSESDPVYSANTYAVDMNQNVGTDDSVSFTSISDGTCTITGGSLSGCTYSETDPVYSANTYATGMNQGVATSDSPDFTGLTVGSVAVLTSESDPVYSANTYAVDMNQNVGTDDSVSFTSISDGTCTITGGSLSGCTYSETDPVYSANTYAVDMNQNVGTDDTPSFTGLTLPGSGGSWSVYVDAGDNSLNFVWS